MFARYIVGKPLTYVLSSFLDVIGNDPIVCHNAAFEQKFLASAYRRIGKPVPHNRYIDTLPLARRLIYDIADYKLSTTSEYLGLEAKQDHRALKDCRMLLGIYEKLNELRHNQ